MANGYGKFMNTKTFKKATYSNLNAKQKENYNFHRLSSLLASFGFNCIWLNDDVHGADFLAISTKGDVFKIQLKSRLTFDKKYIGKDLYLAFPFDDGFYVYLHDEALKLFIGRYETTSSWNDKGIYHTTTKYESMVKYFINESSESISF